MFVDDYSDRPFASIVEPVVIRKSEIVSFENIYSKDRTHDNIDYYHHLDILFWGGKKLLSTV